MNRLSWSTNAVPSAVDSSLAHSERFITTPG